jgi:hypothetical protein
VRAGSDRGTLRQGAAQGSTWWGRPGAAGDAGRRRAGGERRSYGRRHHYQLGSGPAPVLWLAQCPSWCWQATSGEGRRGRAVGGPVWDRRRASWGMVAGRHCSAWAVASSACTNASFLGRESDAQRLVRREGSAMYGAP